MGKNILKRIMLIMYFVSVVLIILMSVRKIISIPVFSLAFIVQSVIIVIVHEFSHGISAEKNGLMFTSMYIGPFVLLRENRKFTGLKKVKFNGSYLGRANIENREIKNDDDFKIHSNAWRKAIKAGPVSDIRISTVFIIIGIYMDIYEISIAVLIIDIFVCIPSFIYGDGEHLFLIKNNKVFEISVIYTYSMIGNISNQTDEYLYRKLIDEIDKTVLNDDSILPLCIAAQSVIYKSIAEDKIIPESIKNTAKEIVNKGPKCFSQGMDIIYFRSLINTMILYYLCVEENKDYAERLYLYVKGMKCSVPGERIDKMRTEHILGKEDHKKEIESGKYRNQMFYGCVGFENMENIIDDKVIEYSYIKNKKTET